jgi:hypothetical protein
LLGDKGMNPFYIPTGLFVKAKGGLVILSAAPLLKGKPFVLVAF